MMEVSLFSKYFNHMTAQLGNVDWCTELLLVEKYVEGKKFHHVPVCQNTGRKPNGFNLEWQIGHRKMVHYLAVYYHQVWLYRPYVYCVPTITYIWVSKSHIRQYTNSYNYCRSNLVIRNFLVTLKLFLNAKCSLSQTYNQIPYRISIQL